MAPQSPFSHGRLHNQNAQAEVSDGRDRKVREMAVENPSSLKGCNWNLWPRSDAVACDELLLCFVAIIQVFNGENDKPIYKPLGLGTPFPENNIQQLSYNSKNHCLFSTPRSDEEVKMPSMYGSKCSPNYLNVKHARK